MFGAVEHTLFVEKYRPSSLDGYVGNEHIVDKVKIYIESGDLPHLLLYGKDLSLLFHSSSITLINFFFILSKREFLEYPYEKK